MPTSWQVFCANISVYLLPYVFSLKLRYLFIIILISKDKWSLSWTIWCSKKWSVSSSKQWPNGPLTADSIFRSIFFSFIICDSWFTGNDPSLGNNLGSFHCSHYCSWWKGQTPLLRVCVNFSYTGTPTILSCWFSGIWLQHFFTFTALKLWKQWPNNETSLFFGIACTHFCRSVGLWCWKLKNEMSPPFCFLLIQP